MSGSNAETLADLLSDDVIKTVFHCAAVREPLPGFVVKRLGEFDRGGRFNLYPAAQTDSSRAVRSPSRTYPFSEYKHAFTVRYARQLAEKLAANPSS